MHATRAALLGAVALILSASVMGVGSASAQTKAPAKPPVAPKPRPLPPGLTRSGNTVMMQPIASKPEDRSDKTTAEAAPVPMPDHRPSLTQVLSPTDRDLFEKAFSAGDRGDWIAAKGLADQGHDAVARRIIIWRYLTDRNGGASFDEIARFLREHPGWPLRHVLFARAEHAMPDNMSPGAVIAWFGTREPSTGIGKVRLGEALIATGKRSEGRALIRKAWIADTFEPAEEQDIIQHHGDILTPEVDRERLNRLIWSGDLDAARRELSRVDSATQRIAQVRMALRTNPRAGERMVSDLPAALQSNPDLLFDRARSQHRLGNDDDVPALLIKAPTDAMAKIDSGHWWGQFALAAREALKDGNYRTAYTLVADTGLTEGSDFAEAEFMAGWIALRFLHEPEQALTHFKRLAAGVTRPISQGRALYWIGRAYEAAGKDRDAARAYRQAAEHPETFYGQLAVTRIETSPRLRLNETPAATGRARAGFRDDNLIHAIRVLADLGEERFLRLFAVHDVDEHQEPGHIALLAGDLTRMGYPDIALRVAKTASYDGIDLLPYSHPVIALPHFRGPGDAPERALVLGLIRQETEFNADAVSRAGARGIMQIMPQTARHLARLTRLPYRHRELATDAHYNIQLGMTELSGDLAKWDGSYILAAAAYNAGSTNVNRWITTYGDPRTSGVDPIDWIEQIPFSETRNYVQRVIENTEVYRDRLAGRSQPLQILADLYRPGRPPNRAALPPLPPPLPAALPATVPEPVARPNRARAVAPHPTETATLGPQDGAMIDLPRPAPRPVAIVIPKEKPAR